jgi:hypothetical protein
MQVMSRIGVSVPFTLILTFPCRAVNDDVENEPQASSASRRAALILSRLKPKATHAGIGNSTIIVRFGYLQDAPCSSSPSSFQTSLRMTRWSSRSTTVSRPFVHHFRGRY